MHNGRTHGNDVSCAAENAELNSLKPRRLDGISLEARKENTVEEGSVEAGQYGIVSAGHVVVNLTDLCVAVSDSDVTDSVLETQALINQTEAESKRLACSSSEGEFEIEELIRATNEEGLEERVVSVEAETDIIPNSEDLKGHSVDNALGACKSGKSGRNDART